MRGVITTYLESESRNTASSLDKDIITSLEGSQSVESVPGSKTSASKSSTLTKVEVLWQLDESLLRESTELGQCAINDTSDTRGARLLVESSVEMLLVEQSDDVVTLLEAGHVLADGDDGSGSVRASYGWLAGECCRGGR